MRDNVLEINQLVNRDAVAADIANYYQTWHSMRIPWIEENKELRNYLFATDTSTTSNNQLDWKNKTTIPKLTQIRDNLHANYMNALFPNDRWIRWEAYSKESADKQKRDAIEAYMDNKVREGKFIQIMSDLLYDYIDYGNCFPDVDYITETVLDPDTGESNTKYEGPIAKRISPIDIVFNPLAADFENTPKITRALKTIGGIAKEVNTRPEWTSINKDIMSQLINVREGIAQYNTADVDKANGFQVDGFGDLATYYGSNFVEVLEFEGDYYDKANNKLYENHRIVVLDRSYVVVNEPIKSWTGKSKKRQCGWRDRPDNLYAMGPLDNLVGMQYRIDHLENLKADAMDFAVWPMLKIKGNVEEFDWEPGGEIFIGEDGDVDELGKNLSGVISADNQIAILEGKMEMMAGAPREAAGIRSPGEKTAFEVQALENAAGRLFQHKINQFERKVIEPVLNDMLEIARRNLSGSDVIRVMDDDLGVVEFLSVTKEDITAKGKIRPIGSRHFAAQAQLIQNVMNLFNSGLMNQPAFIAHISFKNLAKMVEDVLGLDRFDLFKDNAMLFEQAESTKLMNALQEGIEVDNLTPVEEEVDAEQQGLQTELQTGS
jgi:hypothetical protein